MKKESQLNRHEERKARLDVTIEERCLQVFGIDIAQKSKEEYTLEKKDGLLKLKPAAISRTVGEYPFSAIKRLIKSKISICLAVKFIVLHLRKSYHFFAR